MNCIFIIVVFFVIFCMLDFREGMNMGTDRFAWFEPEGYPTHNSIVNPEVKPLMYKYGFNERETLV